MRFPERSANFSGSDLAAMMEGLGLAAREAFILDQVRNGCVPDFMRGPANITLEAAWNVTANLDVAPDYLCLGTDDDWIYAQCSIVTAQRIADELGAMLPTKKLVDAIWKQALVKVPVMTETPDATMVTPPVFLKHSAKVREFRIADGSPLGELTAGGFKDYILVPALADHPDRTCIYGWHQANGKPVQDPNASSHDKNYVDYSQCPRFISQEITVGDDLLQVADVLAHPLLHVAVADGPSKVHRVPGV